MTKTIRPYKIHDAGKKVFGKRVATLEAQVRLLASRLGILERKLGAIPQVAEFSEEEVGGVKGSVLIEKGGTDASSSEG